MMTEGQRVAGAGGFGRRGDGGETLMEEVDEAEEEEGEGELGGEAGLFGCWKLTVSGESPGVGGRTGSSLREDGGGSL